MSAHSSQYTIVSADSSESTILSAELCEYTVVSAPEVLLGELGASWTCPQDPAAVPGRSRSV